MIASYSDGEASGAMTGVALWKTGTHLVRAGTLQIPEEVREQWDRQRKPRSLYEAIRLQIFLVCSPNSSENFDGFTLSTTKLLCQT